MSQPLLLLDVAAQTPKTLPNFHEANDQRIIERSFSGSRFVLPLTLLGKTAESSSPITLTLGPIARTDGYAGKPATISTSSEKELVVKRNAYLAVQLEGELPEFTTYRSWLMLTSGDESVVYDLALERRAIQLVFTGAANNRLELSTSSRKIDVPITFKLADGQSELNQLQLSVASFARLDGRAIERETLKIAQSDPLTCKAGDFQTVKLVGTNMLPGKYWVGLNIRTPDSAQWLDVQLNCAEPTQRISVVPVTDTSGVVWFWSGRARAKLTIDETAGQLAVVYTPRVDALERANDSTPLLNLADVNVTITADSSPAPEQSTSPPQASASTGSNLITTISERDSQHWSVTIENLSAGKYKAKLSVAGPELAKSSSEFNISVRHAAIYACLPIGLGVLISFLLQNYVQNGRANRIHNANIAGIEEQIRADQTQWNDLIVWPKLLAEINKLRDDLKIKNSKTTTGDFDNLLKDIVNRRTFNLKLLGMVVELDKILSTYPVACQTTREQLKVDGSQLQTNIQTLLSDKLIPTDGRKQLEESMASFNELLKRARRDRFSQPIAELLQEVVGFKTWADTDISRSPSFLNRVTSLLDKLRDLQTAVGRDLLVGMDHQLNDVTHQYYRLRVDDLEAQLNKLTDARRAELGTEKWQAFDSALRQARASMESAKNIDSSEKSGLLSEATLRAQGAQIEYLQVAVDNNCPAGYDLIDWRELIDANVTHYLKNAREAAAQSDEAGVVRELQAAQAGYKIAMGQAIGERADVLVKLVRKIPASTDEAQWNKTISADDFTKAIDDLRKVNVDPVPNLLLLVRKFELDRIKVLRCAVNACQRFDQTPIAQDTLSSILQLLQQAYDNLTELEDSDELLPQLALSSASQQVAQAQASYQGYVAGEKVRARSLTAEVAQAEPTIPNTIIPAVQVLAAPAISFSPTQPLPPPETPATEREILQTIQRDDRWVTFVAMTLATLAGFNLLYLRNDAWGTCSDYIMAVFWGFGLNEAGKGVLTNLSNLGIWPKVQG